MIAVLKWLKEAIVEIICWLIEHLALVIMIVAVTIMLRVWVADAKTKEQEARAACQTAGENTGLPYRYTTSGCQANTPEFGWTDLYAYIDMRGIQAIRGDGQK